MSDYFTTHGDDAPSGDDLEYDPEFLAMEAAAQPEEERQAGDEIVEGKDPDYKDLAEKAKGILARCHDIRAAVHLADSELRLSGLEGFAEACRYIRFCLEDHWATCYPQLDEEDDDDPTMRINAVTNLAGRSTILRGLRTAAALSESRNFGRVTLRDIEIANGDAEAGEDDTPMSTSDIEAAYMDTDDERMQALLAGAKAAQEHVNAIDAVFMDKTPGFGPSLEPLQKMLNSVVSILSKAVGSDAPELEDAAEDAPAGSGAVRPAAGGGVPGQISSRADVTAALDRIIDYYNRHEPSSPLPMVLERAKRLVGADFMTIINDLAPLGADNVKVVGGIVEEEAEY